MNLLEDSDDGNVPSNYHRNRRSSSVGDLQAMHMNYNYVTGAPPMYANPPMYGGSVGYGNMVQPMGVGYYNAPMMAPPMLEVAAYYNQPMCPPMYANYGGPAPSVYGMGAPGTNEVKVDEDEVLQQKRERALQTLLSGFVIFLNGFLLVSDMSHVSSCLISNYNLSSCL